MPHDNFASPPHIPSRTATSASRAPLVLPGTSSMMVRVVPLFGGRLATMAAQFFSLALIARAIGPGDFGVLQVALVAFIYLAFVGDLGTSVLGTRDHARVSEPGWVGIYLGARILLGILAVGATVLGAAALRLATRDLQVVAILAVGLVSASVGVRWLLQAREQFARIAVIDLIAAVVQLASAILLTVSHGGVVWAAATMASGPVVAAALSLRSVRGALERPRIDRSTVQLIRAALPAGVAVFATSLFFSIDSILLGILRTPEEVGYYGAAYRFVFAALALPTVANAVALPVFSRLLRGPQIDLVSAITSMSRTLLYVSIPLAAATTLVAPLLVDTVFGAAYADTAAPLAILIWTCVTVSANTPFAALMLARRLDRRYMLICLFGGATNLALNLWVIPRWGVIGAAWTSIATELVVLCAIIVATADVAPRILLRAVTSAILPTMIACAAVWPFRDQALAIPVGIAAWTITGIVTGRLRPGRLATLLRSLRDQPGVAS